MEGKKGCPCFSGTFLFILHNLVVWFEPRQRGVLDQHKGEGGRRDNYSALLTEKVMSWFDLESTSGGSSVCDDVGRQTKSQQVQRRLQDTDLSLRKSLRLEEGPEEQACEN